MNAVAWPGFTWPRWAPTAYGGAFGGATGGDEARFASARQAGGARGVAVAARATDASGLGLAVHMGPDAITMKPCGSTDRGWQALQDAAVTAPASG